MCLIALKASTATGSSVIPTKSVLVVALRNIRNGLSVSQCEISILSANISTPASIPNTLNITIKWFSIWKDFCYELFTDILKYNIVNRSFTGDVHTQPYLYKLHMIFNEFNILSKLEIIDIKT